MLLKQLRGAQLFVSVFVWFHLTKVKRNEREMRRPYGI